MPYTARWWRFLRTKRSLCETSLCGRRREPSQHNIVLFPKKNLETCILSIAHAIPMQPLRVKAVAVTRNSIPVGSKANTGRNALDRMVKMGEKRSMTSVLRPIKKESRFGLYRQIAVGCQQQADGKPGDGDSCQSTSIQIGGKTA